MSEKEQLQKKAWRQSERGSALVYILIAIALLAALTVAFMNPSSNQTSSQNSFKTSSEIQSQIEFIRSTVQECVLTYMGGDAGVLSYYSAHNYPIMPDDTYLDSCIANPSEATHLVSALRCPGNPGDDVCHEDMFGGMTGKYMPQPPNLFNGWQYYNGDDGVFIWTYTTSTDSYLDTVLDKLDTLYSKCEADRITTAGSAYDLTSDMGSDVACPANSKCFRVWLKTDTTNGSPAYQEAGCP